MSEIRSGTTLDTKQNVKESPSTHRDTSVKCFQGTLAKGGNTSNMAKHLSDRHPNFSEFKERQVSKCDYKHEHAEAHPYTASLVALAWFSDKRFSPSQNFDYA